MVNIKKLEGTINGRNFWIEKNQSETESKYDIYISLTDSESAFVNRCVSSDRPLNGRLILDLSPDRETVLFTDDMICEFIRDTDFRKIVKEAKRVCTIIDSLKISEN